MPHVIDDVLLILTMGLLAALVCKKLGVSPLVGYLLAGAILGPGVLGLVSDRHHEVEHIAELGVFLLLFSIGLELSLEELAMLGRPLLVGGSLQMVLVALPTGLGLWLAGQDLAPALLIACALAFSSTVLVFKALNEAGQSTTKPGRRAIGILLFQDAALVPLLLLVPILTQDGLTAGWRDYALLGLTSALFIVSILVARHVLRRWVIPTLAGVRSPELVVLFTLVMLGGVTLAAYRVGLPPAVGAFAAGLVLSNNRWTAQMDALILPFRESFAAVFFVSLGLLFRVGVILDQPLEMGTTLLGLMLIKMIAGIIAVRLTGLSWLSSLALGLGLAHVGEFAFVLLLLGVQADLIAQDTYQRFVTVAFLTLLFTPLLLKLGLRWVQDGHQELQKGIPPGAPSIRMALVIGIGPVGRQVAAMLETCGHEVFLIDRSSVNLYPFAQQGFRTIAGDATNEEILHAAHGSEVGLAIICVPDDRIALEIVKRIRRQNNSARVVVRCRYQANQTSLLKAGANDVVNEEHQVSRQLMHILDTRTAPNKNPPQPGDEEPAKGLSEPEV